MSGDAIQSVEVTNPIFGSAKVSGSNVSLILGVGTFIMVAILAWIFNAHAGDSKDSSKEVAKELKESNEKVAAAMKESNKELGMILKELAQSTREQNCLLSLPQERRAANSEICKRISR